MEKYDLEVLSVIGDIASGSCGSKTGLPEKNTYSHEQLLNLGGGSNHS